MNSMCIYGGIFVLLLILELLYFKVADRFNIIDRPNERSSHTRIVLRGGGIIFTIGLWVWSVMWGFPYPWMLAGVTLAAGVSFVDDIHSLPDSLRLVVQFVAMTMILYPCVQETPYDGPWQIALFVIALFVCVGSTNIYNFMDGINGITGGYAIAVIIPLLVENEVLKAGSGDGFIDETMLIVIGLSVLVFCFFNFRTKARCFAGDVGSIGIALILVFCIVRLILRTEDVTWLLLLMLYEADGCMTILHRIMLHENLGQAHRKHAFQLMANELKMPHVVVSSIYMGLQLMISLAFIFVVPDTAAAHWIYFISVTLVMALAYILFMKRYYPLHEAYLLKLKKEK